MVSFPENKIPVIASICFFFSLAACTALREKGRPNLSSDVVPYEIARVARVTGKTQPGEHLPNPNQTHDRYDIGGTDLGIAWDMGDGKTGLLFGDTYGKDWAPVKEGGPGRAGNWRSNVLGIAEDRQLEDGITFTSMISHELIPSPHIVDGSGSHTAIPTAAVNIAGVDYVHFMDIRKWGGPGSWATNYSGLYRSPDKGKRWEKCNEIRFSANSNFAQTAYAKKSGYVYMTGTVSGRWGAIYLARFKESAILKQEQYEYWNKTKGWVSNDEKAADPIINAPAGELSLAYYTKFRRWIITYLNEDKHQLVMRTAKEISGIWSAEQTLASAAEYPGLYGAFIYPGYGNTDQLFFLMSMWQPYNVFLMKARLK
ncbi:DUF4185 domain-containing protein [Pedobacter frigoris]|uniref:DUF4185 domain-containing protein n=1 Tax=Pedobacter frigoris TaxID=2571272 RepID=UPI00292DF482|nr:DUF4185 domain-containing protein [Pedobacter frigoris]